LELQNTKGEAMTTVSLDEAQAKLAELVDNLAPGDEVVITKNNRPFAQLTPIAARFGQPVPGRCKGMLTIHSDDDDHLKDWAEYMA
jgi:prevent-host-death family protein